MIRALTKYVGSKRWLLESHADRFPMPDHGRIAGVPFVGGGSVAAFYGERGVKVVASDLNPRLINAHVQVQRDVDSVLAALGSIASSWRMRVEAAGDGADIEGRLFFEGIRAALDKGAPVEQTARFLFVVRAGFNGLYREGPTGECNTAYGKPAATRDLVAEDELRAYAATIRNVEFHCEDFAVTAGRCLPGSFFYADPPYDGTFDDYARGCDWGPKQPALPGFERAGDRERLVAILAYLDAINVGILVSDARTQRTEELYRRWSSETVYRDGTVNSKGTARAKVAEGLWGNRLIARPALSIAPPRDYVAGSNSDAAQAVTRTASEGTTL